MLKEETFNHNGNSYTLRAETNNNALQVIVLEGVRKIATYSVTLEADFDARISGFSTGLIDSLMQQAEDDIEAGIIPARSQ